MKLLERLSTKVAAGRKALPLIAGLFAGGLTLTPVPAFADTFYLIVHGRSDRQMCTRQGGPIPYPPAQYDGGSSYRVALQATNGDGKIGAPEESTSADGYWKAGSTDHISNVWSQNSYLGGYYRLRYIGWDGDGNHMGGAWDWNPCGARAQIWAAMLQFCTNGNVCHIYTHSTGSLVVSSFIAHHGDAMAAAGVNIGRIQFMDSASGGSELADYANCLRNGGCYYITGVPIVSENQDKETSFNLKGTDASVATYAARPMFDHNQGWGYRFQTVSGYGWTSFGAATGPMLPGKDDSVLAGHSICNVNKIDSVEADCGLSNTTFRHRFACGFMWLSSCYYHYARWTPYYTIYHNGHAHDQGVKYWKHYRTY